MFYEDKKKKSVTAFDLKSVNDFFMNVKDENLEEIERKVKDINFEFWKFKDEENSTILQKSTFYNSFKITNIIINSLKNNPKVSKEKFQNYLEQKNKKGFNALHYTVMNGNIKILNLLLENNINYESTNNRGLNVLHIAAQNNKLNMMILFKEKYKFDIESTDDEGSTPLHWACYTNSFNCVEYLLSFNINVNIQDKEGLTPLHLCIIGKNNYNIIKLLLQYKANPDICDNKGYSCFDLCEIKNKFDVIYVLKYKSKFRFFDLEISFKKKDNVKDKYIYFYYILNFSVYIFMLIIFGEEKDKTIFFWNTIIFILNILFHIYLSKCDPGFLINNNNVSLLKIVEDNLLNLNNFCPICKVIKTNTSKHCVICNKCINNYEHHCLWFNNCIGEKNYHFFIIFIIFLSFNVVYVCLRNIQFLGNFKNDKIEKIKINSLRLTLSMFCIIITYIFAFPLFSYTFYHILNFITCNNSNNTYAIRKVKNIKKTNTQIIRDKIHNTLDENFNYQNSISTEEKEISTQKSSFLEPKKFNYSYDDPGRNSIMEG